MRNDVPLKTVIDCLYMQTKKIHNADHEHQSISGRKMLERQCSSVYYNNIFLIVKIVTQELSGRDLECTIDSAAYSF